MTSATTRLATLPASRLTAQTVWTQIAGAAVLAVITAYGVAFTPSPLAHNAAHDVRHVTSIPCH